MIKAFASRNLPGVDETEVKTVLFGQTPFSRSGEEFWAKAKAEGHQNKFPWKS
jgi:hypothetical protein